MPAEVNQRALFKSGIVQEITDKNGQMHTARKWESAYDLLQWK